MKKYYFEFIDEFVNLIIKLTRSKLYELDKRIAFIGIITSVLLIIASIKIDRIMLALSAVFMFIICSYWLSIRGKAKDELNVTFSRSIHLLLSSIFFLLLTVNILILYERPNIYERPLSCFIIIAIMSGIVACDIIFSEYLNPFFVLSKIIIIALSISWSQQTLFPDLLGIDPWWHRMFTTNILYLGFIPKGYSYSYLPIFHIFIASTMLFTNLQYKLASIFSVGLSQVILDCAFIYLIGEYLSYKAIINRKISLLAPLFLASTSYHIYMNNWLIPNTLGGVIIVIVIFFIYKLNLKAEYYLSILLLIFSGLLIWTHTISALALSIILATMYISSIFYNFLYNDSNDKTVINLSFVILFLISMMGWWTYATGHIVMLAELLKWGFSVDYFNNATNTPKEIIAAYVNRVPLKEELFTNMGILLYFSLSILGFFYILLKRNETLSTFATIAMIPLIITYISQYLQLATIEVRWWYVAEILLSIPVAITSIVIFERYKSNGKAFLAFFIFAFIIIITLIMILNPDANIDNNYFTPNTGMRYALSESEISSIEMVSKLWHMGIFSDEFITGDLKWEGYDIKPFCNEIYKRNLSELKDGFVLIRSDIIGKQFKVFSTIIRLNYNIIYELDNLTFSKVYDCKSVSGFIKAT